ncbi:MAG: hypothetical protein WAW57_07365 [Lutibacter sp.]
MNSFNYHQKDNANNSKNFIYPILDNPYIFDYPIFCFKHLVKKYCLDKCDKRHKTEFITRLAKLSELGFKEINSSDRHSYGCEKISKDSLNIKIPSFITEDVDFLYAYRYNGRKNPFLAYRRPNSSILHIIAIDFNFTVYDHG